MLVTHGHLDHIGGIPWLVEKHSTPVYTSTREAHHLRREYLEQIRFSDLAKNLWRPGVLRWTAAILRLVGGGLGTKVPTATGFPNAGAVDVPGNPIPVLTPGHTSGHTAYYFPAEKVLVCGDAFVTGHGTSRRSGPQLLLRAFHTDVTEAASSLNEFLGLDATTVLPGHGPRLDGLISDFVATALEGYDAPRLTSK